MAESRAEFEWTLLSHALAMTANSMRDPKKKPKPFKPDDFNPYARTVRDEVIEITKENVHLLRKEFTGKG